MSTKIYANHSPQIDEDLLFNRLLRIQNLSLEQLRKFRVALFISDFNIPLIPFQDIFIKDNNLHFKKSVFEAYQSLDINHVMLIDDEGFIIANDHRCRQQLSSGDMYNVGWTLQENILLLNKDIKEPITYNSSTLDPSTTISERLEISHAT